MTETLTSLAILGGTFDPVHFGHLRTALELKQRLSLDEMRLMPSYLPPHRIPPRFKAIDRMRMLKLAIASEPELSVDDRELQREGVSYMSDTLAQLREEVGDDISISLVLGMDSFLSLPQWHEWELIPQLAHLIVVARPGVPFGVNGIMERFLHAHETRDRGEIKHTAFGRVLSQTMTPLDISATRIRNLISSGYSPRYLLPDSVWDYIQHHGL